MSVIIHIVERDSQQGFHEGFLAQIKCRVLAWLAGETDILAAREQGKDIYSAFASTLFREAARKPNPDDPSHLAKCLKALHAVGKRAILGMGFGMVAARFEATRRSDCDAGELFGAGVVTSTRCEHAVAEYRSTYGKNGTHRRAVPSALVKKNRSLFSRCGGPRHPLSKAKHTLDPPLLFLTAIDFCLIRHPTMERSKPVGSGIFFRASSSKRNFAMRNFCLRPAATVSGFPWPTASSLPSLR